MSRLYSVIESDRRKTASTATANESAIISTFWGSRDNSKLLIRLRIEWIKDQYKPTIY